MAAPSAASMRSQRFLSRRRRARSTDLRFAECPRCGWAALARTDAELPDHDCRSNAERLADALSGARGVLEG